MKNVPLNKIKPTNTKVILSILITFLLTMALARYLNLISKKKYVTPKILKIEKIAPNAVDVFWQPIPNVNGYTIFIKNPISSDTFKVIGDSVRFNNLSLDVVNTIQVIPNSGNGEGNQIQGDLDLHMLYIVNCSVVMKEVIVDELGDFSNCICS